MVSESALVQVVGGYNAGEYNQPVVGDGNIEMAERRVRCRNDFRVDHNDWSVATWFNASSKDKGRTIGQYNNGGTSNTVGWGLEIDLTTDKLSAAIGKGGTTGSVLQRCLSIRTAGITWSWWLIWATCFDYSMASTSPIC